VPLPGNLTLQNLRRFWTTHQRRRLHVPNPSGSAATVRAQQTWIAVACRLALDQRGSSAGSTSTDGALVRHDLRDAPAGSGLVRSTGDPGASGTQQAGKNTARLPISRK